VRISKWVQAALHPAYEFVFYLSALFTAAWASGNAAEITGVVAGTTSFGAISDVLLLVALTTVLHSINRWALLIQREAAARSTGNVRNQLLAETDNLLEETAQLRHLVRTMPEGGFLDELGAKYMIASNAAGTVLEADEVVPAGQVILAGAGGSIRNVVERNDLRSGVSLRGLTATSRTTKRTDGAGI